MRRLKIEHTTTYSYDDKVQLLPHKLLLRPREGHDIRIETSKLEISPANQVKWHRDAYGNSVAVASFSDSSEFLSIVGEVVIQHYESAPLDFLVEEYAVHYPFHYNPVERVDLIPYEMTIFPEDGASVRTWLQEFWQPAKLVETYAFLDHLNKAIADNFEYEMREEPGVQSPALTLSKRSGSCRDFATLFNEACRYVGLAARFVSGYLYTPPAEGDHGATHAWSEVYLPGAGWRGFDSTSGQVVGSDHIAVAVNRHPEAIPPVGGSFVGPSNCSATMEVAVKVTEI